MPRPIKVWLVLVVIVFTVLILTFAVIGPLAVYGE